MPNFVKIGQSIAKILRFFNFSRWRPPPSWIFKFVRCYWVTVSGRPRRITVPNFVKIGSFRCRDIVIFRIFKMAAFAISDFWNREILLVVKVQRSRRIFMPNCVKIGLSVAKILRFFDFSRWQPSAILDLFRAYWDHPQRVLLGHYHSAKFGCDRCSSFYYMSTSIFDAFGWKMPIYAPKIGVFGNLIPKMGCNINESQKGTPLRESASFEPLVNGLTCRWVA